VHVIGFSIWLPEFRKVLLKMTFNRTLICKNKFLSEQKMLTFISCSVIEGIRTQRLEQFRLNWIIAVVKKPISLEEKPVDTSYWVMCSHKTISGIIGLDDNLDYENFNRYPSKSLSCLSGAAGCRYLNFRLLFVVAHLRQVVGVRPFNKRLKFLYIRGLWSNLSTYLQAVFNRVEPISAKETAKSP